MLNKYHVTAEPCPVATSWLSHWEIRGHRLRTRDEEDKGRSPGQASADRARSGSETKEGVGGCDPGTHERFSRERPWCLAKVSNARKMGSFLFRTENNLQAWVTLDSKEIKSVNQPWIFIERTDAEAPILWPPDEKSQLFGKEPAARKDWRQEEKGATEDEMGGWHLHINGHEFGQTPGDGEVQESLACCSPWSRKESNMT